jgi:hypothetical protein
LLHDKSRPRPTRFCYFGFRCKDKNGDTVKHSCTAPTWRLLSITLNSFHIPDHRQVLHVPSKVRKRRNVEILQQTS